MSDIEINSLNGKKGESGSDHFASRKKNDFKSRKCMDFELHDHLADNNTCDNGHLEVSDRRIQEPVEKNESTRVCDFDSDDDTFADADSDCEPNQFFLDEMLEDSHPERLNLLDYRKEEQEKGKRGSSGMSSSSHAQNDENDTENDGDDDMLEDSSTSRHDGDDEDGSGYEKDTRTLTADVDCESTTDKSDEDDDSFGNLPTIRDKATGRLKRLNNLQTSPDVGPGRPLLRQASQKAVWGK